MSTNPVSQRYYPALSELITVDDLPDFLQFAGPGLEELLNRIHYKNFQFSKSARGDSASYSLDVVTNNLGLDLPFGLRLVLNPSEDDVSISAFPISVQYQWELLAFLRGFNLQNFAFTPEAFFELGLQIFKITDAQVIAHTLNYFVESEGGTDGKFVELVDTINDLYPAANLQLPVGEDPTVELMVQLITGNPNIPDGVSKVMFVSYVLDTDLSVTKARLEQFYALMVPDGIENYIRRLIKPKLRTTLTLSAGIQFPKNILRPVNADGSARPEGENSVFRFAEATFYADTEAGIGTNVSLAGSLLPAAPVVHEIGRTGLTVSFTNAKLDLSTNSNIPEADAAGYPLDFTGLYVEQATIGFNRFGSEDTGFNSANLYARDLLIGNGGVTGTIGLESNGALYRKFGNFAVELKQFSMTFRQGAIVASEIDGELTLPVFKSGSEAAKLGISASIYDDGNFKITAKPLAQPLKVTWPNVFELEVRSLEMGKTARGHYIEVAGRLDFIADLPVLGTVLPKGLQIDSLRIWDNGDIEFKGGMIRVPRTFKLKVGPVNLEVSDIHIGAYRDDAKERSYHYFGFDGMINTGRAGIQTSGNGIKYYFSTDDKPFHHFIRIDGIDIDLAIPNRNNPAVLLRGHLAMSNPDPTVVGSNANHEYTGSVSFTVPKLRLSGSAGMRMDPSVPAFLVDIGLELANPVPLGGTGLGIYGFRGIVGQHYMPHKAEGVSYWDYYRAKSTITGREGVELDKFVSKPGFSFGAGLSLATSFDSGRFFSSKLFMLLGLPQVFIIQGQAGILRERIGLQDDVDPPFSALIVIGDNSVHGNLAVDYYLPEKGGLRGKIFELHGQLDMAFFFNNASGWYINIGKDNPERERVRAKVLTLFNMHAYLMLSMQGIKAGAGARIDFQKRFLGISVGFGAYLNLGGFISLKPVQIGGFISLGAYVYFKIFKFKLGFDVSAMLAVEAPHPFNIIGSFQIRINLPWPFKDLKINIDFSWRFNNDRSPLLAPIDVLQLPNPQTGYLPAVATHILTGESFGLNYVKDSSLQYIPSPADTSFWASAFGPSVTIPLDSFIDIELLKPVKPGTVPLGGAANQLPRGYTELLPPQKGANNQVKHEFEIVGLEILAWNGNTWAPYHVYEAVTAIVKSNVGDDAIQLSTLKQGYWQFQEPGRFNKIRLLSQHMFSYSNKIINADSDLNSRNFSSKAALCFTDILNELIVNWKEETLGYIYPQSQNVALRSVGFSFTNLEAVVKSEGTNSLMKFLEISGRQGSISINLPKSMGRARIEFGSRNVPLQVNFYSLVHVKVGRFRIPITQLTSTVNLPKGDQAETVLYDNNEVTINGIMIKFNPDPILDFTGNLLLGARAPLPDEYVVPSVVNLNVDKGKVLYRVSLFNRSFNASEAILQPDEMASGMVAHWSMLNPIDSISGRVAIRSGAPIRLGAYWMRSGDGVEMKKVYQFIGNKDGWIVAYEPSLKIEDGNFAVATSVLFKLETGVATLLTKLAIDQESGSKKGYTLHVLQESTMLNSTFTSYDSLPKYKLILSFYHQKSCTSITIEDDYAYDCERQKLINNQYKHILFSIDRQADLLEVFLDGQLRYSGALPAELDPIDYSDKPIIINEVGLMTPEQNQSLEDNGLSEPKLIEEIEMMENGMNKSIQPVWRPNTTYAVRVVTQDKVDGKAVSKSHTFGFRTAGPIGHFHLENDKYIALADQDRADEFKLKNLRDYIDFQRSYPDAQGRMDISKPVYYHDPQIRLFFLKEYVNAMFSNWDAYQSMDPVESRLSARVIDTTGTVTSQELIWLPDMEQVIDDTNYESLPQDLRLLYLLNKRASEGACNGMLSPLKRKVKRGGYIFADLRPNELYTAVFNAVYKAGDAQEDIAEVHRFNFMTSRFASFTAHVGSFVDGEVMSIFKTQTAFTSQEIQDQLIPLINESQDDDPLEVRNYQTRFDRLVMGGMKLRNIEILENLSIRLVVNLENDGNRRLLGLMLISPEPLNDPKLGAVLLQDTVKLTITGAGYPVAGPGDFIYLHSQNNASVFITNQTMNLGVGTMSFKLRYKQFNGVDYDTVYEDYQSPLIDMNAYLN
ncbi:hypothetical protein [Pedobacter ureilyticus]|uniref:Uncharacterized protein n=1 Tax=Pedobacter ureilyticus TaxID=1393051 RepID=A0ABW9J9D7_9SPHI|nr:hypothetical protein [Pedobacter helvus]